MTLNVKCFKKYCCLLFCTQILVSVHAQSTPSGTESAVSDDEFSIVVIPDTQYYTSEKKGGKKEMFDAQTKWIVDHSTAEKIAYVIHLGDVSDDGEKDPQQWVNAAHAMYLLETPQPGYPEGIPYGMTVGNHDQTKSQYPLTGKTDQFNHYFGVTHFQNKKWYGGHYKEDNDSHFDLFEAAGIPFIAIYLEYDAYDEDIESMNKWAGNLLEKYSDRKAFIISHSILHLNRTPGTNEKGFPPFSRQGQRIFDRLKTYPNVMMTLSGHVGDNGEGYRQDGYAGNVIQSFLTDYQSRSAGGHGLMRIIRFSKSKDLITCSTFSPYTGEVEKDADSKFTLPWFHHTNVARYMDIDNDQLTNLIYFNKGQWTTGSDKPINFGKTDDIPVPADYNGDGKVELSVFRPSEGKFIANNGKETLLGQPGDIPVCGDWDGDGFAEYAVYRPSNTTWYFNGLDSIHFGHKNGIPVPADYDGDGKLDLGIYRTDNALWQTALGNIPLQLKQVPGDIPVPADYDGDGKAEMALFRPGTGEWLIDFDEPVKFGQKGDIPVPGNYQPGGKTQLAVYREGNIILQDQTKIPVPSNKLQNLVNISYTTRQIIFH